MTARLVTAPTVPAVDLADVKRNLRIDSDDTSFDANLADWIAGVVAHAEHYTGRALMSQAWRVALDAFPDVIDLPVAPVLSVATVKYYDSDGVLQTLASTEYTVDTETAPGRIVPAPTKSWPSTQTGRINAVLVDLTAGYGTTSASTPAGFKLYLLAKIAEQFDPNARGERVTVQSTYIDMMLDPFKIWSV